MGPLGAGRGTRQATLRVLWKDQGTAAFSA
jgi:hypothetical protein